LTVLLAATTISLAFQPIPAKAAPMYLKVTSVSPSDQATTVAIDTTITAVFSEDILTSTLTWVESYNLGTIKDSSFRLMQGSTRVSGTVGYNRSTYTATFKPSGNLTPNTTYEATITTYIKSIDRHFMLNNYTWSFTTEPRRLALKGFSSTTFLYIDSDNKIRDTATLNTTDGKVTLDIAAGTEALNSSGSELTLLTSAVMPKPPAAPADNALIMAYTFDQDGTTFNPALMLTMKFLADKLPPRVVEKDLYLAYYDGTQWQPLESTLDSQAKTVSAKISHFSVFAMLGQLTPPTQPTITSVSPPDNALEVAIDIPVTAIFSEALDSSTLTTSNYYLMNGPTVIPGRVTYDRTSNTLKFTPSNKLAYNTIYVATIKANVKSTSGQLMTDSYTWSFTTVEDPIIKTTLAGFYGAKSISLDRNGIIQSPIKLKTANNMFNLDITAGTKLLDPSNSPLTELFLETTTLPPPTLGDDKIVTAYTLGPDEAIFDPALTLTLKFSPARLPPRMTEKDLYIAYYDGTQWQPLESTLDTLTKTVSANISHSSVFALMGKVATPVKPTPSDSQPGSGINPTLLLVILIVFTMSIIVFAFVYERRIKLKTSSKSYDSKS
jgi:hypothetical protein